MERVRCGHVEQIALRVEPRIVWLDNGTLERSRVAKPILSSMGFKGKPVRYWICSEVRKSGSLIG
jgi:hypothetical protein